MRRLRIYSYLVKFFFLFLVFSNQHALSSGGLVKEYSRDEARFVYQSVFKNLKSEHVVFNETDLAWQGLNMELLLDTLDNTKTAVGSVAFRALAKPVYSRQALESRRAILDSLVGMSDEDFQALVDALEYYADTDNIFTHLLEKTDGVIPNLSPEENEVYRFLPKNLGLKIQLMMSASAMLGLVSGVLFEVRQFRANYGVIRHGVDFVRNDAAHHAGMVDALGRIAQIANTPAAPQIAETATASAAAVAPIAAADRTAEIRAIMDGIPPLVQLAPVSRWSRAWLGLNLAGQGFGLLYGGSLTYSSTINIINAIRDADAYVLAFAHALANANEIADLLDKDSKFAATKLGSRILSQLKSHQKKALTKAIRWRLERDQSSLYSYTPLLFWDMIEEVGTYDDIKKHHADFIPLIRAVGELDSFVNVAKIYRDRKAAGLPVTFPAFIESDTSEFTFKTLHNPLFAIQHSVPIDLSLGREGVARHGVFTGPHACGKTSAVKAVALGHVSGQGIGIVFAETAELAPVRQILTYLNVGDDIGAGLSSFAAEDAGIQNIKKAVNENLVPTLIVIDEMYAKTNLRIAPRMASDFLKQMYQKLHVAILLTTHFEDPSKLEALTGGVIKNFQPEVKVLPNGDFNPTFKMLPGAADWWFSDEDLMVKFIDWTRRRGTVLAKAKLDAIVKRSQEAAAKVAEQKKLAESSKDSPDEGEL